MRHNLRAAVVDWFLHCCCNCVAQARDKQMARLAREEQLAGQQVQLANGKRLRLADLQGSSRVVLVAGTTEQVRFCFVCARGNRTTIMRQ
jgi:hypothetical protein